MRTLIATFLLAFIANILFSQVVNAAPNEKNPALSAGFKY
jgi:hypothetical protein